MTVRVQLLDYNGKPIADYTVRPDQLFNSSPIKVPVFGTPPTTVSLIIATRPTPENEAISKLEPRIWALEEFVNNHAPEGVELARRISVLEKFMDTHVHYLPAHTGTGTLGHSIKTDKEVWD